MEPASSAIPISGWLRWLLYLLGVLVFVLGLLALPMACTTTIRPPGQVREPMDVVLLDHGRHASLVLPTADGRIIRYAYGDWAWYARRQTGLLEALPTLLWPTQGALGRRVLHGPVTLENVDRRIAVPVEQRWAITVEQSRIRVLRQDLEQIHQQHLNTLLVNRAYNLNFVYHPDAYSYFHNSNHVTVDWLRRLGCEVDGPAFASRWRVVPASPNQIPGRSNAGGKPASRARLSPRHRRERAASSAAGRQGRAG